MKNKYLIFTAIATALLLTTCYLLLCRGNAPATTYTVAPGESIGAVAAGLKSDDIIKSETLFKIAARLNGNKIQTGIYDIPKRAGTFRIANMMARGRVASVLVTIPEGLTIKQIVNLLNENPNLTGKISNELCTRYPPLEGGSQSASETTRDAGRGQKCTKYSDGDLFPDTYKVPRGTSRDDFIKIMANEMRRIRGELEKMPRPKPLKNWNEVITLASIVQRETPKFSEMPTVASVYLNRLKTGMRLQADPTVVYQITGGLGDMNEKPLLTAHLKIDGPYNTYTRSGLPAGPIANPGAHAIRAVLKPADTTYYYFVADGTGGHKFSRTLDEHNDARAVWKKIKENN
ncbi:MAG: endolytic transglycosylase MltG [Rickettsiales bacterium]|jgi:UPF0755 protein|nr:endolytic transglycosylase MltG [Rickettsiales bacterium]